MFDNFKVYKVTVGVPTISITDTGVSFNKQAIVKLGYANYIRILINKDQKQVAIVAINENDDDATIFCLKKDKPNSIRLNYRDLTKTLLALKSTNSEFQSFKVEGEFLDEHNALLFDFNHVLPIK
ncbi:hypothetical protein N7603_05485 [Acholeplasma vituli]|uniref:Uncharacterized protein n=1 Tax=Paracholeplasma vituli TaxID=69473 RepID=A0ABT2PVX4_9MOLU|nr:hypothetical protein [Paracholeplasma vituli]MCU0105105.1 hypothetical protein [Paracholeplasma vituli]